MSFNHPAVTCTYYVSDLQWAGRCVFPCWRRRLCCQWRRGQLRSRRRAGMSAHSTSQHQHQQHQQLHLLPIHPHLPPHDTTVSTTPVCTATIYNYLQTRLNAALCDATSVAKMLRNYKKCFGSNYSSRIIFSYTFTLEPNTNRIGRTVSEILPLKVIQDGWRPRSRIWSKRK